MSRAKIVRIGENPPEAEMGTPSGVLSGHPTTKTLNYYTDPGQQFFSGIWESTPGKWAVDYVEEEFCALQERTGKERHHRTSVKLRQMRMTRIA